MADNKDKITSINLQSTGKKTGSLGRRRILQLAGVGIVGGVSAAGGVGAVEKSDSDAYSNTIIFEGADSGESSYEFLVSGTVSPHEEIGVDDDASITRGHVTGTVEGETIAYRFNGDINYIDADGGVTITILYDDDGEPTADRIQIVSNKDGEVDYTFTVTDSVEKVLDDDDYPADDGDTIVENGDGTWTVDGSTENGNGDTYDFHGEIEHFEPVEGEFTLFVNGEETTVTDLTGQEPVEDTYPLTIDDFDGGEIRDEWGNASNHATTDAVARSGSHSMYRVEGSSLYDDGSRFADAFQEDGRFIGWSVYVDEMQQYTSFRLGFNADGPPAPDDFNELAVDAFDEEIRFREDSDGERTFHEIVPISFTQGEWYDIIAWWGHGTVECWVYHETGEEVGYLRADGRSYNGNHWWLFDGPSGDSSMIDDVRFYEEHPYTGRYYTEEPEVVKSEEPPEGIYISPDGDDSAGDGTIENPYYSPNAAFDDIEAMGDPSGEQIICRGGTYYPSGRQVLDGVSGTASDPIVLRAYPGEHPNFNFSNAGELTSPFMLRDLDYFEMRDIEIQDSYTSVRWEGQAIRARRCENCVFENLHIHDHSQTALRLAESHNNLIKGCEFSHNFDSLDSPGANGLGLIGYSSNNIIEDCSFHHNVDDGFDILHREAGSENVIRYCVAWRNGYHPDTGEMSDGWNAGFKPRGESLVHHCVAFDNSRGFGSSHSPDPITFHNCTGFDNQYYDFQADTRADGEHEFRNCSTYGNRTSLESGAHNSQANSWNLDISDPEFISTNPDDELFLHLSGESLAIDAGVDVGQAYGGTSPDLGAFDRELDTEQLL